jgi:hypothetical protein
LPTCKLLNDPGTAPWIEALQKQTAFLLSLPENEFTAAILERIRDSRKIKKLPGAMLTMFG